MKGSVLAISGLLVLIFTGCLAQPGANNRSRTRSLSTSGLAETPTPELFLPPGTNSEIFWHTSTAIPGSLTIDQNAQTVAYLRGSKVSDFLSINANFQATYCLVLDFGQGTSRQLRIKTIPTFLNISGSSIREKVLRVDFFTRTDNASTCTGTVASPQPSSLAFAPGDVCPSCTNSHPSVGTRLYRSSRVSISEATKIGNTIISLTGIDININPGNNTSNPGSSCTNSDCLARGFDCCLDGQCINDGEERPEAFAHPDYPQALADITRNPVNYRNYPEIFFICSGFVPVQPTPTPTPNLQGTATARLEQMKDYYFCLEKAEETPANYSDCLPNGDLSSYNVVKDAVWTICQCTTVGAAPPEDPRSTCPNYNLIALDSTGNPLQNITRAEASRIAAVRCGVEDNGGGGPFQQLNVQVSARSAPHRFFTKTNGTWIPSITELVGTPPSVLQVEGEEFLYIDEVTKNGPQGVSFNMNAILGQFSIDPPRALPAKVVEVTHGLVYRISTNSGTYTPCPTCQKDQWFDSLTAFPSSSFGTGVQAFGHSTKRDALDFNYSLGNYEDTVFGRACWIPPTMIPYSHKASDDGNVQTQRLNRLKTQAALWMNGYQRDWYGFNLGALIGSFDGVSWFAIGKDRRVFATSDKLFLAINSPFADLADPSELSVSVIQDQGEVFAAPLFDFDPDESIPINSPLQNQGATCQQYHFCSVDRDCITRLGWEYVCTTVNSIRTLWPRFTTQAEEIAGTQLVGSIATMIHGDVADSGRKRCVYRGAGALCRRDYHSIADENKRALLTCAPNFYCASLSGTAFNDEVARMPRPTSNILYGQDADVLGRPLNYVTATKPLPDTVRSALLAHESILSANLGMCRPGKSLQISSPMPNPAQGHSSLDISKRTDYINQIASCNNIAITTDNSDIERLHSCPILTEEGNHAYIRLPGINAIQGNYNNLSDADTIVDLLRRLKAQNSCGGESLSSIGASPFSSIEALSIPLQGRLENPTVLLNGCLRRAGAVCHTDLDCSPNKLHAEQAELRNLSFFGNTQAEKNYWLEYLVCGQGQERSTTLSEIISTPFDLSLNRCCREKGKNITLYTQGDPESRTENEAFTSQIIDINPTPAFSNPSTEGRYSRWTSLGEILVMTPLPVGVANPLTASTPVYPRLDYGNLTATPVPSPPVGNQWKAIGDVATKTCCGGGWIRKFRDNSNNWSLHNRLTLNILNFQCINFRTRLITESPPNILSSNPVYAQENDIFCRDPKFGGCIQYNMTRASDVTDIVPPSDIHNVFVTGPEGLRNTNTNRLICPTPNGLTSCNTFASGNETCLDDTDTTTACHSNNRAAYPYQVTIVDTDTRQQVQNDLAPYNPRFVTPDDLPVVLGVPTPVSFATHMSLDGLLGNGVHILGFRLPAYVNGIHNVRAMRLVKRSKDPNDDGFHEYDLGNGFSQTTSSNLGANYRDYDTSNFDPTNAAVHVLNHDTDNNWYDHCVNAGNVDTLGRPPLCICPISDMPAGCTPQTCPGNYGKITQAAGEQAGTVPVADQTRGWCYEPETGLMWVKIKNCDLLPDNGACSAAGSVPPYTTAETAEPWEARYTVALEFYPMGTAGHCYDNDACRDPTPAPTPTPLFWASHNFRGDKVGLTPGNDMYYLQALSRLELMGIPQVAYQPIMCSWDADELVPGIYDSTNITTLTQFKAQASFGFPEGDYAFPVYPTATVTSNNGTQPAVYHTDVTGVRKIDKDPIFSNNIFYCCQRLGQKVSDPNDCCSGHGVLDSATNKYTCKLRLRTNLNVYFNKFISNEGSYEEIPESSRLLDSDFNSLTGELLPKTAVYSKLINLGREHCDTTGVFTGAAFGQYLLSIADGKPVFETLTTEDLPYGIVFEVTAGQSIDTNSSNAIEGNKGSLRFNEGRRWNHHIYCGDQP